MAPKALCGALVDAVEAGSYTITTDIANDMVNVSFTQLNAKVHRKDLSFTVKCPKQGYIFESDIQSVSSCSVCQLPMKFQNLAKTEFIRLFRYNYLNIDMLFPLQS
jgi:hypothetical protein